MVFAFNRKIRTTFISAKKFWQYHWQGYSPPCPIAPWSLNKLTPKRLHDHFQMCICTQRTGVPLTPQKSKPHSKASVEAQNPKYLISKNKYHSCLQQCIVPNQQCQHEVQAHQSYKLLHLMQQLQCADHHHFYNP